MNLQLLANSNIKLPDSLSHINMYYGYSYLGDEMTNLTVNNSFTARQLLTLDSLLNRINPVNEDDQKVVNELAEKSHFLDSNLPENFTKKLKIQINVNTKLNNQFTKIATTLFNPQHPLTLSVLSGRSFMYPNTQQVVIGTKEFDLKNQNFKKGVVIFNYSYIKQSSVKQAVAFTLFHEVSHTLEDYNNNNYGCLDDKTHKVYSILQYFKNNIQNNEDKTNLKRLTPKDYNLDDNIMCDLDVLYGEIYADCGAAILQRNYDIKNNIYNRENFNKHLDLIITSRECEKVAFANMVKDKVIVHNHYTVPGLEFLTEQLKDYDENFISGKTMHSLCQQAVSHGINKTLESIIENHPEYKKQIELLFNMSLVNEEIQIAKKFIPIENYLSENAVLNNSIKLKA